MLPKFKNLFSSESAKDNFLKNIKKLFSAKIIFLVESFFSLPLDAIFFRIIHDTWVWRIFPDVTMFMVYKIW